MVLQGQDKWRKHPLIFRTWKRPFPMLGTAVAVFALICIGEELFSDSKSGGSGEPVFRTIKNENGQSVLQKRVLKGEH